MDKLAHIPLILLEEETCGYFKDRNSSNLLVHPKTHLALAEQELLGESGFRRNGRYFYRPFCGQCNQCVSIRIPVDQFKPSRTQRKLLNRQANVILLIKESSFIQEHYDLYFRYLGERHHEGDMYPPTPKSYHDFLIEHAGSTKLIELRDSETLQLLAVAVTDFLPNSLSAVYTFYEPTLEHQSLGTLAILKQIELAKKLDKSFLYLGFWIPEHVKMHYKTAYAPFQLYFNERWHSFQPE